MTINLDSERSRSHFLANVPHGSRAAALLIVLLHFDGMETVNQLLFAIQAAGKLTDELVNVVDQIRASHEGDDVDFGIDETLIKQAYAFVAETSCELAHQLSDVSHDDRPALRCEQMVERMMSVIDAQ